jgi:hypothetical protein
MRLLHLLTAGLCAAAVVSFAAPQGPVTNAPRPGETVLPMPEEPEDVNPLVPGEALPSFEEFCWRSFLAVNRTVPVRDDGTTGQPAGLADPEAGERPAWMAWLTRDTLLRSHPTWQQGVSRLIEPAPADSGRRFRWAAAALDNLSKPGKFASVALADINNAGDKPDTFVGPVVDQNRRFVRYEIRFNKVFYEHALRTGLFDRRRQPSEGQLPAGFPPGSVVVKAAWRVITDSPADQKFRQTCFHAPARMLVNGKERTEEVGLVGLHLVLRTPRRPQWVWSSFEHLDNVPPAGGDPELGKAYSFNYGAKPTGPVPRFANSDPKSFDEKRTPQALADSEAQGEGTDALVPVQVVREKPLLDKTQERNRKYQDDPEVKKSVWKNYQLVVCQFPTRPEDDNATFPGAPYPGPGGQIGVSTRLPRGEEVVTQYEVNVANTTMETYFQNESCLECHSGAGRYGIAYMYSLGRRLPPEPPEEQTRAARRMLGERTLWDIADNAPADVRGAIPAVRARDHVTDLDRRVLGGLLKNVAPPILPEPRRRRPGDPIRRAAAAGAPEAAAAGALATGRPVDADFREVHDMFNELIQKWENQKGGNCPPEITKRHGRSFGWVGDDPWHSWKELEEARFLPPGEKGEGLKLIDPGAPTVGDMLLIKVLRGEQVEAAKNKQMPLNGPYMEPKQINRLVELIGKRYGVRPK